MSLSCCLTFRVGIKVIHGLLETERIAESLVEPRALLPLIHEHPLHVYHLFASHFYGLDHSIARSVCIFSIRLCYFVLVCWLYAQFLERRFVGYTHRFLRKVYSSSMAGPLMGTNVRPYSEETVVFDARETLMGIQRSALIFNTDSISAYNTMLNPRGLSFRSFVHDIHANSRRCPS